MLPSASRLLRCLVGGWMLLALPAAAQVAVSPILIVLNDRTPYGAAYVINGSTQAQEVTLDVVFTHPVTDSTGQTRMEAAPDSALAAAHSLVSHLMISPRRLVLQPGSRQTIRFTVRGAQQLPGGTRWARLVTTSRPFTPYRPDSVARSTRAGLSTTVAFLTPVLFRKGLAESSPRIDSVRADADSASVYVTPVLSRTGNTPLFGMARARLINEAGQRVAEQSMPVAVYVPLAPRFTFSRATLPPGVYYAEVEIHPERDDLPSGLQRPFTPLSSRAPLPLDLR